MKYYDKKFKLQVPGNKDAYSRKSLRELSNISGYVKVHLASPLKWCAACGRAHCRRTLCLPTLNTYSFELMLCIFNGNLGCTGTHFSLNDIFDWCNFLLLEENYVCFLFHKYILVEDKRTYSKVEMLFLIRKIYESGYHTLAFFLLNTFQTVNPPGTFDKFLRSFPSIFDNCQMFW